MKKDPPPLPYYNMSKFSGRVQICHSVTDITFITGVIPLLGEELALQVDDTET